MIYLDHNAILAAKLTPVPRSGRTVSGYGRRLATQRMVMLDRGNGKGRWYRVYAICYSNAASLYVNIAGFGMRFIDGHCEDAILEREIG